MAITIDDSFSDTPQAGSIAIDDTFSDKPVAIDTTFSVEALKNPSYKDPLAPSETITPDQMPKESIWTRRLKEARGAQPGLDDNSWFNKGGPVDVAARGLEYLGAGANTAFDYLDEAAKSSGLADALSWDGNKFLPGSALGALSEAFPAGGMEVGMVPGPRSLPNEVKAELNSRYASGTADEILQYARENGAAIDEADLRAWVKYRDENPGINKVPAYQEQALNDAYSRSNEALPGAQQTARAARVTNEYANEVQNTVETLSKDWKAAPQFRTVRNVDELEDGPLKAAMDNPDGRQAKGVIDGDGVVHLFADNLRPGDVKAVAFHEGLGHHGMTQRFTYELDDQLRRMYDASPWFKKRTDEWIAAYPDAYAGPNQVVRAADEVLAELSEAGVREQGPAKVISDRIKNFVNAKAREIGITKPMSEREVRSVLDMAHDAVINGDGDAVTNGFRYSRGDPFWNKVAVQETAALYGMDEASVQRAVEKGDRDFAQEVRHTQTMMERGQDPNAMTRFQPLTAEELSAMASGEDVPRFMRGDRRPKSLTENIKTERDLDDLLLLADNEANDIRIGATTIADIQRAGEAFDMRPSEFLKSGGALREDAAARVWRGRKILANTADRLAQMQMRAERTGLTPMLKADIARELGTFQAVYSRVRGEVAEAARVLRTLREDVQSRGVDKIDQFMGDIAPMLNDDEALLRFLGNVRALRETNGVEAAIEHISNLKKVRPEDYAKSIIYNFMLSNPKTWMRNFVGSPLAYGYNAITDIGKIGTQAGRAELKGRLLGPLGAFSKADVYKTLTDTADAFKTGQSGSFGVEGTKTGTGKNLILSNSSNHAVKLAGMVIETPQRIMAATDQFWSSIFSMGNIYGEAARVAGLEGLEGAAYSNRLAELIGNPTKEILDAAKKVTDKQLFRDHENMSYPARKFTEAVKPRYEDTLSIVMKEGPDGKMVPVARTVNPKNTVGQRVAKFAASTAVPFVPTIDSITRFVIRNSGPASLLSKEIRSEIMNPATRTSALGRLTVGSALMGLMAYKASKGELTGADTGDFRETGTTNAVKPPMSIKIGDQWVSYQGLDPLAGQLSLVSTSVNGAQNEKEYQQIVTDAAIGVAASLKENSYAEAGFNLLKMVGEAADMIDKGKGLGPTTTNFVVGQAANLATPGAARFVDDLVDDTRRDTSGDGSVMDRLQGRVQGALPGLSNDLPARRDPYGREINKDMVGGLIQSKPVETDPYILEMDRIERSNDGVQIGAPSKKNIKVNGEKRNLTATEFQQYQEVAGELLRNELEPLVTLPGWQELTEEEKLIVIKDARDRTRKDAREALFGDDE